tara:strand:- start:18 stop:293 length:276 start_codon:yes stop_codon:yes gene_type:complete
MARKDRGFGFEGGNIVPFSRGKQGVSSSWVSSPSETNQRTIESNPIMIVGALGVGSELQKYAKKIMRNKSNEKINKLRQALENLLGSVDKD